MKTLNKFLLGTAALAAMGLDAAAFPIAAAGTEGLQVIVANDGPVVATYEGNSASYFNDLLLNGVLVFNNLATPVGATINLGQFKAGTELMFELHVYNTGYRYFTGSATRNPDVSAHARVQANWAKDTTLVSFEDLFGGPFDYNDLSFSFTNTGAATGTVPELSSALMLLLGLMAVMALRANQVVR